MPLGTARPEPIVFIVDDDPSVRAAIKALLASVGLDSETFGSATELMQRVSAGDVGCVIMDVRMPNVDGLEATRRLLDGKDAGPRILILTTFDLDEYVYEALRAGASGFLLKDTPPEELVEAIRTVAAGDALLSPEVTCRVVADFARTRGSARPPELDELSADDTALLGRIAAGLSNADIAAEAGVDVDQVSLDVERVLAALRLRDRMHAVVFAHEHGLVEPT